MVKSHQFFSIYYCSVCNSIVLFFWGAGVTSMGVQQKCNNLCRAKMEKHIDVRANPIPFFFFFYLIIIWVPLPSNLSNYSYKFGGGLGLIPNFLWRSALVKSYLNKLYKKIPLLIFFFFFTSHHWVKYIYISSSTAIIPLHQYLKSQSWAPSSLNH